MLLYFHPFFTNICISSSFSQSALVRFSRGMLQKFFQISLLRESISAAWASVTAPLAVLYILCSFLRTCEWGLTDGTQNILLMVLFKTTLLYTIRQEVRLTFFSNASKVNIFFTMTLY